ncbi:MAG: 4'-phosphopantetheinyl transferase family protein [Streptosporangiaceae bacterium]
MTDRVRVWILPARVPPQDAARFWDALDDSDRARAAAFLSPRDRQRFTVAHGALRMLAGYELSTQPATLTWIPGRYGKPVLAPPWSGLHTSLSHSGDLIAMAISTDRPVGVDVQYLVPGLDTVGLATRFFPPDEAGYVAAGPDASTRADRFALLWTRKEAVVKAAGGRLWSNLKISVRDRDVVSCAEPASQHRVTDITMPASFHAAVALTGVAPFTLEASRSWITRWPGAGTAPAMVTGPSPRSRSPRAADRGSAAGRDQARGRTAGPRRRDG